MRLSRLLLNGALATVLLFTVFVVRAQDNAPPPFRAEEIDALLAPIALYPDALLSQVLMAATYPLEVVEADRWSKSKSGLKGDDAVRMAEHERWDVSVKSLTAFPNLLDMMSKQLEWTQKLGDAFLAQQGDVLDSVQRLRLQAQKAGNLQSSAQQVVKNEGQSIIIEPAQTHVVYVPAYNPSIVYGSWGAPSYPPFYYPGVASWYPGQSFVRGFMWGAGFAAANSLFGGFGWNNRSVNINVDRAIHIDRNYTRNTANVSGNTWRHSPAHRGGVAYRDKASRETFGSKVAGADARRDLRGANVSRENARQSAENRVTNRSASRPESGVANAPNRAENARTKATERASERVTKTRPSALDGVGGGRERIDRGQASSRAAKAAKAPATERATRAPAADRSDRSSGRAAKAASAAPDRSTAKAAASRKREADGNSKRRGQ